MICVGPEVAQRYLSLASGMGVWITGGIFSRVGGIQAFYYPHASASVLGRFGRQ